MTSIALARKWRPRTFSELVGQEHVTKALLHSLAHQRLHHAYLFTGTRGVGKTSVARLLAKALNCEQGLLPEPCLQCDTCLAIEQGNYIDLIEIDGASKTRVEDTRDLLDNVPYAPTLGRFKIYLIDEVHMLSTHSFNALLKTLEEPPAHVKFLLATTDPQKLPLTVLSRCLQFHLRPLPASLITNHLTFILNQENIPFAPEALPLLAKAARGSMRDALSLLDQAIASGQGELCLQEVKNSLGMTQRDYTTQLLRALADSSVSALLALSAQMGAEGANYPSVLDDILSHLHQMSIIQALGTNASRLDTAPALIELSHAFSPEDTQLLYQIALKGTQDLLIAPTLVIGFEMTLLRMHTFMPVRQDQIHPHLLRGCDVSIKTPENKPEQSPLTQNARSTNAAPPLQITQSSDLPWDTIITQLHLTGLAMAAVENAAFVSHTTGQVVLRVAPSHRSLFTPTTLKKIEHHLGLYYQEAIKLTLQSDESPLSSPAKNKILATETGRQEAQAALRDDPFFQTLQQTFSAELVKDSIEPRKDSL